MSFLELEPAVRHLRQLAKTHAAGGLPREDYRRARREIIEELLIDFAEQRTGSRSPIDRFSIADETTHTQPEEKIINSESLDVSATPRTSQVFWRTLLCVSLALAVLFAGQSINAAGL